MNKFVKFGLSSFLLFFICLFSAETVLAKDVNYKTYKYGTSQISMADGYYARPAKVVADGNRYLVTMTIRTKHNLSPWPVKVNTINGQSPLKITKTRHGTDYDYNYSFYADNLDHKISSSISIDVPKVYKADHQISFMFDQNLPALKKTDKTATKDKIPTAKLASTSHPKRDESKSGQKTQDPYALISQAKKQSEDVKKEEVELAAQRLKQNQKNRLDNEYNERMFYYVMLGGIICLIILIVACVFFVLSIKNNKRSKNKK